jgi:hypothetical protein
MPSSTLVVDAVGPTDSAPQGDRHRHLLQPWWWPLLDPPTAPPRGATIDVFSKLGGGHCWTRQQHPLGGPPLTSCTMW